MELYLDYLYNFSKVEEFYKIDFRNTELYPQKFKEISTANKLHRTLLPDIILQQYADTKISKLVETNISLLKSSNTLAIVTGQQLSIFGGPLYTIYKTITAIKLSRHLKEKYDSFNFVPVFWLEGDDHDFEEVSSVTIMDKTNNLKSILYNDGKEDESNRGSIGKLKFEESISETVNDFLASLRDSEFKEEISGYISEYYKPGVDFSSSFRNLLNRLFGEYGLVIFNPQDIKIKKLLRPIFQKEINNFRTHADNAIRRSAELEEHYHAQVKVRPVNLFLSEDNARFVLEPDENGFKLRNKRKKFTIEELLTRLDEHPEDFSSNVLLRPICQDFLLPTAFYIGGPSEIAYFAQVIPFYDYFNLPQPFIYPRASATILEKNIAALLEKFVLQLEDIFGDQKVLTAKVLGEISEINVETLFNTAEEDLIITMDKLKEKIFAIDPTLVENANKSLEKILQTIGVMKTKVENAVERKNETVLRQLDKLRINLYPDEHYQERVINYTSFAIKYGNDFVKWIYNELSINKHEHQILEI
jgi:bacillithiol biosynthesis cysteine-adding enzyme BshC